MKTKKHLTILLSLILVISNLFVPQTLVKAEGDSTAPVLNSISIDKKTATGGDTLTVTVDAQDDISGVQSAIVGYKAPSGIATKEVELTKNSNGKYTGQVVVGPYDAQGTWMVVFAVIADNAGNIATVYNSELFTYPIEGLLAKDLSAGDFQVIGTIQDITAPVLNSVSIDKKTATGGDTLKVTVDAQDDLSGVDQIIINYKAPEGNSPKGTVLTKNDDGKFTGDITVEPYDAQGIWKLSFIALKDTASNISYVLNSEVYNKPEEGTILKDLSSGDFEVTGTNPDTIAPTFNSITIDKKTAVVGDTIKVTVDAQDDISGVSDITINYISPSGNTGKTLNLTKDTDGKYRGDIIVEADDAEGVWKVDFVILLDNALNSTVILNSELSKEPVTDEILKDLSAADFEVKRAAAQTVRYGGASRFETAVQVSNAGWTSSENVVLVNAYGFADALAGVPFAYLKDAPILLTDANSIPKATMDEITRLGAKNIYILGGTGVVSQNIENDLENKQYNVVRLAGTDRFDTGIKIGNEVMKNNTSKTAIVTTAYNYPDALSIGSYAAIQNYPILYTETNVLSTKTKEFIKNNGITKVIIPGGVGAVSEAAANELRSIGVIVERISGADRYETGLNIVNQFKSSFKNDVILATGSDFPDALAGGVLAAKKQIPILLVDKNYVSDGVKNYIKANGDINMYILGGTGVVPDSVIDFIKK